MSESFMDFENEIDLSSTRITTHDNASFKINEPTTRITHEEFDFATPIQSVTSKTISVDPEMYKYTYPSQVMNLYDRDTWTVSADHCYARPWNWRPESNFLRPTKTLFVPKSITNKRKSTNPLAPLQDSEDIIDVESGSDEPTPIYDVSKANHLMEECDRYAALVRGDRENDDWEDKISKVNWTPTQYRLFNVTVGILNNFHLSRLSQKGIHNEPLLRRSIIDKSVERIRRLLATVSWDTKLTQWLHHLLVENLSTDYLSAYLDILQTLKAKLPTFVDKMMYGPTSSKHGLLNNENLFSLLKRQWDPVASSLMQDKPKKLPGNPVIIIVPSAPTTSKRIHKWITLLSNLATVVTIPTNFGSAGHRMTMINCVDQMCATTRGKIQEIRADYPGRHIVLLGFNTGATLALQLAQVEPVMCVVCLGFSLLTAEGKRGEPDDTLLELQCPVLFVIGQCSNTSLQEDMEDLRERMRVETGLIVVGSADDYLRVNKKKKKAEGITQSVVDRCVVDEVGEFVSGVILSPYPPQIRQSPTHASAVSANKKSKERKRFNSNASSLDSEPPSPTPRITRPVGRPPGSKSKSKLEAKWAAQIAQGTSHTPSPSSTPPPLHTPNTPDTSSNDSSLTEKQPVPKKVLHSEPPTKKIKTLKPVLASPEKALKTVTANATQLKGQTLATAKLQAYGFNRSVMTGGTLSTLLQGGIKTIPPTQPRSSASGIKVLENVTLNSGTTAKIISNTGRAIDLSKITVFNSMNTGKSTVNALGNVVLLPDGKIKSVHGPPIKGGVNAPMLVPMSSPTKILQPGTSYPTHVPRGSRGKYITSKRQLIGNKPPRPTKKINYMPPTIQATLPPPTNLTTQDIMDLPIIFADDNQLIDNTLTSEIITSLPTPQIAPPPKIIPSTPGSKFVLVNKQIPGQGNFIISPSNIKKPAMVSLSKAPPKYTKIILSKRSPAEELKASASNIRISNLSPEISVKKVPIQEQPSLSTTNLAPLEEPIDLENELVATAVPKPNYATSDVKNITIITKKNPEILKSSDIFQMKPHSISHQEVSHKLVNESVVDSDPDYIPPKTMKLDSAQS